MKNHKEELSIKRQADQAYLEQMFPGVSVIFTGTMEPMLVNPQRVRSAVGETSDGREITFVPGPELGKGVVFDAQKALETAADLELEAKRVKGDARHGMLRRAGDLFNYALRLEAKIGA